MSENQSNFSSEAVNSGFNIKDEIFKYLSYWKWFLLSLCLGVLGAFLYLKYTPEYYASFSKMKILDESKELMLSTERNSLFSDSKNLDNEIEVIRSKRLLKKVVDSLDLHIRYFFEGQLKQKEIWKAPFTFISTQSNNNLRGGTYFVEILENGYRIKIGEDTGVEFTTQDFNLTQPQDNFPFLITANSNVKQYVGFFFRVTVQSISSAAGALSSQIGISRVGATDILRLSLVGENKQRSESILNKLMEQFNLDGVEDRQLVYQRTIDFVDERFVYLAEELDSIEVNKKEFQQDNDLVSFGADVSYSMSKKTGSENAVLDIENQIALSKLLETPLTIEGFSTLMPQNLGLKSADTNNFIEAYNSLVLERNKIVVSAGENNPKVLALNSQLKDIKTNLKASLSTYYKQLGLSLEGLKKEEDKAVDLFKSMPQKEKILRSIERQQNLKENLYLLLLQKREQAAINLAITSPSIKVVEYAASSWKQVSPDVKGIYTKGIIGALLIPFGIIFLIFKLDTKVQDKIDVRTLSPKVPIIGEVPQLKEEHRLFSNPHDRTMLAESFRILSTNLNYILPPKSNDEAEVIYITSSIKGEGKTFVSVNLSLAFSSINKKVLLIGADLRNPKISVTDGHKKAKGLSDYLFNYDSDWRGYLQKSTYNVEFLDVLTAGTIPPNPTELLSNGRIKSLLDEAKNTYDYIIIDTAPIILVTDTLLISQHADATVYVTRAGYTEKKLLGFSSELYAHKKLNNMVYVVNDISEAKTSRGYGYNYGYGYGYNNDVAFKKYTWKWFKEGVKEKLRSL